MTSTTSGTTTFNLDVDQIIEDALDTLGGEYQSGIDSEKARRKLNLILLSLQNKNIPLAKLAFTTKALVSGTATYTLDQSIVDVLDCSVYGSDNNELDIERISLREWQHFPQKTQTGTRPTQFVTERKRDAVDITFWPIPDNNNYTAKLWVSKKIEDVTASYQKVDISTRYLPLLVAWLSYELGKTKVGIDENKLNRLKMDYQELLPDSFDEDRERVDWDIKPGGVNGS